MNKQQVRASLLGGLKQIEAVRMYVADARLSKEFPDQENFGPPFNPDMGKIEDELQKALLLLYKGLQDVYPDFEWARSIDGDIPIWPETKLESD